MATFLFPDKCPLIEGYSENPRDSRLISMPDAGLAKIRNRYKAVPYDITERYILTKDEYIQFLTWYENDIQRGATTFIKKHPILDVNREYRFTELYEYNQVGILYEVILNLELMPQ